MSGASEVTLRTWFARGQIEVAARFSGRLMFTLSDVIRLTAMHDLTSRVAMAPADASKAADMVLAEIRKMLPDGGVSLDRFGGYRPALALYMVDGTWRCPVFDMSRPFDLPHEGTRPYARGCIVLPIAELLANVLSAPVQA